MLSQIKLIAITPVIFAAAILPLKPITQVKPVADNLAQYLVLPKQLQFPDMTANYTKTIVEPQQAQEAAEVAQQAQAVIYTPPAYNHPQTGSCGSWMASAGISDTQSAYSLIMRESGCNPNAVNASSGACGIGQQLPCGKWGHAWNDPIGGMQDMQAYVYASYGSWANALAHSNNFNWY